MWWYSGIAVNYKRGCCGFYHYWEEDSIQFYHSTSLGGKGAVMFPYVPFPNILSLETFKIKIEQRGSSISMLLKWTNWLCREKFEVEKNIIISNCNV